MQGNTTPNALLEKMREELEQAKKTFENGKIIEKATECSKILSGLNEEKKNLQEYYNYYQQKSYCAGNFFQKLIGTIKENAKKEGTAMTIFGLLFFGLLFAVFFGMVGTKFDQPILFGTIGLVLGILLISLNAYRYFCGGVELDKSKIQRYLELQKDFENYVDVKLKEYGLDYDKCRTYIDSVKNNFALAILEELRIELDPALRWLQRGDYGEAHKWFKNTQKIYPFKLELKDKLFTSSWYYYDEQIYKKDIPTILSFAARACDALYLGDIEKAKGLLDEAKEMLDKRDEFVIGDVKFFKYLLEFFYLKLKTFVESHGKETPAAIAVETPSPTTPQPALTPAQFTPSPTTPKTFPSELAEFYTDVEYIGKGGFARVFKAKRKKDGKVVAVKIPISLDPATGKSFLREIENWTKLRHPNIVRVYDYNILPIPFFEMEFCESSFEKLPKPMEVREAALLVFNAAEGLKYAHSKGIIHRDLKPSNVLLRNGMPKISDWGLSKVVTESRSTTTTSFTPLYAAPEQLSRAKFGRTDERTDIWQLGVIFYELVTGRPPFESDDYYELMAMILNDDPIPPSQLNPEAKEIEPIIMRMLAKRKEDRYESVAELQGDLATYLGIELRNELKKSQTIGDKKRITYYLGNLLLLSMKTGTLSGAYKYANDFTKMTSGELRAQFEELREQIKLRMEEGLELPVELIEKAEILVHEALTG